MSYVWSFEIDPILSVGRSLDDIGVRNWALPRGAALLALKLLLERGIPVLGGDVYTASDGNVEPTYDNWYCDRASGEKNLSYAERSIRLAREYISCYPDAEPAALFAIVPDCI